MNNPHRGSELNGLRFVIFAHPRSGSTSLLDLLNVHPDINMIEELFHESFAIWHPDEKNYAALINKYLTALIKGLAFQV